MKINKRDIADAIMALLKAGKQFDFQQEFLGEMSPRQRLETAVDFWYEQFKPFEIGKDRWQQATKIAVMLTKVDGLNVNKITPALMKAALKQAEQEYITEQQTKAKVEKEEPMEVQPTGISKFLWDWTKRRLAAGLPFNMADESRVKKVLSQVNLTTCESSALIKAFICDREYCQQCHGTKLCYMHRKKMVLDINAEGKCNIRYEECEA